VIKQVKIVAPISTVKGRTRIYKLAMFLRREDIEYSFWGWERISGEANDELEDGAQKGIILKGGGYATRLTKIYYLFWVFKVFTRAFIERDVKVYHCLGFESAFPLFLLKKIRNIEYVYDDADRFSMLLGRGRMIVAALEQKVSRASKFHIVPNVSRYLDFSDTSSFVEIKNFPDSFEVEKALSYDVPEMLRKEGVKEFESNIVVYVNGWLAETRGLAVIDRISEKLSRNNSSVIFLLAGKKSPGLVDKMRLRSNVFYLGELENHVSLALYKISNYVFTYYDPKQVINRYAESNKWGDALIMGTPIIVNKEVVTAKSLIDSGCAITFRYKDEGALLEFLGDSISARRVSEEVKEKVLAQRVGMLSYDQALRTIYS